MEKRLLAVIVGLIVILTGFALADYDKESGLFSYNIKGNGTAVITGFNWKANGYNDIYIPRMLDGYTVTEIGAKSFAVEYDDQWHDDKGIALILPDTITVIGELAFEHCYRIASVNIPSSVQLIGSGAFSHLNGEVRFSVDSGNSTYATIDGVLYNKNKKELVAYPTTKLGGIISEDAVIPEGITSIGDYAFSWCSVRLSMPSTLKSIGNHAFEHASIEIVNAMSQSMDYILGNIKCDTFPQNLETIGDYAFYRTDIWNTSSPRAYDIILPENVVEIGVGAFSECGISVGLYDDLNIDLSKTKITVLPEKALCGFGYGEDSEVKLPSKLQMIGKEALSGIGSSYNCSKLSEITIPSTVTVIDDRAFYNTLFEQETLTIPERVEKIGTEAFLSEDIGNLSTIVLPASISYIGDTVCDRIDVMLQTASGTYAALWASENGYATTSSSGDDTSWLNN